MKTNLRTGTALHITCAYSILNNYVNDALYTMLVYNMAAVILDLDCDTYKDINSRYYIQFRV